MGRLTLNVLLSFAQFEREVTSERIRDKIAASKRKGLWVGGIVPLGYATWERRSSWLRRRPSGFGPSFGGIWSLAASTASWHGRPS
jgi:DNA invertase Pin-like site-specific DNA recombinase